MPLTRRSSLSTSSRGSSKDFPAQGTWTEDDYFNLESLCGTHPLVEISNGRLEVLPVPTELHQFILIYFFEQLKAFAAPAPEPWRRWLDEAIARWCREWTPLLESLRGSVIKAGECLETLRARIFEHVNVVTNE